MNSVAILGAALRILDRSDTCADEVRVAHYVVERELSATHKDMLRQLCNDGPVWDGDVLSKAARDQLLEQGLASRVIYKGEFGYTAATYEGGSLLNLLLQPGD